MGSFLALGTLLLSSVAVTGPPATIAYAQLKQTWELVLTNGDVVEVPTALAKAPKDAVNAGELAPFLVSGDGRHFFYYRKSDGFFVERTLKSPERVVFREITAYQIDEYEPFEASYDGSYVATWTAAPGLGDFADLRTGKTLSPPEKTDEWFFGGFSPDGKRLLLGAARGKGRLTVFDRKLHARIRLKTRLAPTALANDYVTAVEVICPHEKCRKLRLLNLRTGHATPPVAVRLPRGQYIDRIDFNQAGQLIVRSKTKKGVAIYRVAKATGKAALFRTIVRPAVEVWVLPGDTSSEAWM